MGEEFFININCSKVLENCDESQYTMFIDSTKMSIVYELTEWIRWMFSLEQCIYLMHENSVIHELEDIQFLSKLKNFEIRPCGQAHCVHKKMYRTLLDNLNLFVSWNNVKVHKYFLDKLTKMDKKFNQENCVGNSLLNFSANARVPDNNTNHRTKTDYNKFFLNNTASDTDLGGTPLTKKQVLIDNYISKPENNYEFFDEMNCNGSVSQDVLTPFKSSLNSANDCSSLENKDLMLGCEKNNKTVQKSSSPIKNDLKLKQLSNKNVIKNSSSHKSSHKHVKPFSLGELLSNIREDFKKENVDEGNKTVTPSQNCTAEEENFMYSSNSFHNSGSFLAEDNNTSGGRKRPRIRRRKRPKKQSPVMDEHISPFLKSILHTCNAESSLSVTTSNKPNHIRFNVDDNDELMETECAENEKGCKINEERSSSAFSQTEPEQFMRTTTNKSQDSADQTESSFPINNTENRMECSSENVTQTENVAKLINIDDETCEDARQSCTTPEISKPFNEDLNLLLKLKEKFQNAVVVERFY